jgi:hypothetical protein
MFGKFGPFLPNIGKNGKSATFHSSLLTLHFSTAPRRLRRIRTSYFFLLYFLLLTSGILSPKLCASAPLCEISLRSLWLSNPFQCPRSGFQWSQGSVSLRKNAASIQKHESIPIPADKRRESGPALK